MNSSYSDFKQTHNYSQIDNDSSKTSVECKRVGPIYLIGYLGSAILTKGKTGLGCLQQPLHDLYMSFRCNSSKLFQERRLIISTDGLSLLYNEAGIEKIISNDLSSVNDIQLLRIDCEQRRDKKVTQFRNFIFFFFFFFCLIFLSFVRLIRHFYHLEKK